MMLGGDGDTGQKSQTISSTVTNSDGTTSSYTIPVKQAVIVPSNSGITYDDNGNTQNAISSTVTNTDGNQETTLTPVKKAMTVPSSNGDTYDNSGNPTTSSAEQKLAARDTAIQQGTYAVTGKTGHDTQGNVFVQDEFGNWVNPRSNNGLQNGEYDYNTVDSSKIVEDKSYKSPDNSGELINLFNANSDLVDAFGGSTQEWTPDVAPGGDLSKSIVPFANGTRVNVGGSSLDGDVIAWNGGLLDPSTGTYYAGYGPKGAGEYGPAFTADDERIWNTGLWSS